MKPSNFDTMWHPFPFTKEQWDTPGIKLHLGCGSIYLNDFVNVDIDNPTADENFDAFKLKYKTNSVSLILASHLIEHFKFQDHLPLLTEWHRVLKPNGWLIIEAPNLEESCKDFLESNNIKRLTEVFPQIFGRPDFSVGNIHLSGVWPSYLFDLFRAVGFQAAATMAPIANNIQNRCMRIDAQK
jgi:SAM-dependent methyltransferase